MKTTYDNLDDIIKVLSENKYGDMVFVGKGYSKVNLITDLTEYQKYVRELMIEAKRLGDLYNLTLGINK